MISKTKLITYFAIGLALFTLACQSLTDLVASSTALTPTPVVLPAAAFDPPRSNAQGFVNQPFVVESQYSSNAPITEFEILVNNQPLELVQTSPQTDSLTTNLVGTSELLIPMGQPGLFLVRKIRPVESSSEKTVALTWIASTPGTYNLTIKARDAAGNQNETSQLVEIVTP